MGGTNDPSNLIELSVEEHAEAHRVLFEKYGRKEDELAWKGLAGIIGKEEITKTLCSIASKKAMRRKGQDHAFYGKKRPEHSLKLKGRKVVHSAEHQNKLNSRFTKEYLNKVSDSIAREWEVTLPSGEIILIKNMKKFCQEHNLHAGSMSGLHKTGKLHKGYYCRKLVESKEL
jgi:aspartokinase